MRLNRSTAPAALRIGAPSPERTGIVHLGLGQFHRAHFAVNTALALAEEPGDWGIVGVANRSRRVVDSLAEQDFLYSVLTLSPGNESAGLVDVHRRGLVAADEPEDVLAAIADPAHRIVSLTISEKGYHRTASGVDLASFGDELAAPVPRTPIGLLARGLERRASTGAPLSVVSCDNVQGNGTSTREVVLAYLQAAGAADATLEWIAKNVAFPNTMVDRIVPGTTDATRARVAELLGLDDAVPVPAERFSMWVLEDLFPAGRPRWEAAGAIFSDEVHRYELVKLRILNGMHSLISYVGGLLGAATIPDARAIDEVAAVVRKAIEEECLPSIELPTGFDAPAYVDELFDRWSNTSLGDQTARVGSDGSAKLVQRIPEPVRTALAAGRTPHCMALTLASWLACVAPLDGFDPGPVAAAMDEPLRGDIAKIARRSKGSRDLVASVLAAHFPPDLADATVFVDRTARLLDLIVAHGADAAARDVLAADAAAPTE
ncbi:mannitol dehydrogenase family protein [Actinomyces culturomici]|uniref:mannitol dehydrogenase family protein n=1 Tax=Actinomyces culturomici TaxID=1926276 RepID=UPI000E20211B|nr:mannitol dehydrogenase family protein [Actinomyces culturomici]